MLNGVIWSFAPFEDILRERQLSQDDSPKADWRKAAHELTGGCRHYPPVGNAPQDRSSRQFLKCSMSGRE